MIAFLAPIGETAKHSFGDRAHAAVTAQWGFNVCHNGSF
jgi:hypothetical protein